MLLFFISLFIISVLAIALLHYSVKKETTKKLLHDFQKSCKINSVQFEKDLKKYFLLVKENYQKIRYSKKRVQKKTQFLGKKVLSPLKKKVRNKLFEQGQEQSSSHHLTLIKEHIKR